MTDNEALALISTDRISSPIGATRWADLGCGKGLFTIALSRLLSKESTIYAIDENDLIKSQQTGNGVSIVSQKLNFVSDELDLKNLDGILMANSFHYVADKPTFIRKIEALLAPRAVFLIVEYDTGTPVARWVPYPLSFSSLTKLFKDARYSAIKKLGERKSIYGRANMYSALVEKDK